MFKEMSYRDKLELSKVVEIRSLLSYFAIYPFLTSTLALGVGVMTFIGTVILSIINDIYKDKYVNEKVEKELNERKLPLRKKFLEYGSKDVSKTAIKKGIKVTYILCSLAAMLIFTNFLPIIKSLICLFVGEFLVKDTLELADLLLEIEVLGEKIKRADVFNKNLNNTKNQELAQEKEYSIEKNNDDDKNFKYLYNPEAAKSLNEKKVITYNSGKLEKKVYRKCR